MQPRYHRSAVDMPDRLTLAGIDLPQRTARRIATNRIEQAQYEQSLATGTQATRRQGAPLATQFGIGNHQATIDPGTVVIAVAVIGARTYTQADLQRRRQVGVQMVAGGVEQAHKAVIGTDQQ